MSESFQTTEFLNLGISESELISITKGLITKNQFEIEAAIELIASVSFSSITEPGDQMMGLLIEVLGRKETLALLVAGFDVNKIMELLSPHKDELESRVGNLYATLSDSKERWLPRLKQKNTFQILSHCQSRGIKVVLPEDANWPRGLDDLGNNAPRILYVLGDESILRRTQRSVSVVGSRQATEYGLRVTEEIVSSLSKCGWGTVSGGALGIDTGVHLTSLRNRGSTIAVMAGGVDWFYPRQNAELFLEIQKQNLIMSELPPGVSPTRWRFLQRNRLIAALTPATVVIEAALRSGAIKTANDALLLDRGLFALPGAIDSLTSQGTNELITSGKAQLITSTRDLIQQITGEISQEQQARQNYLTANQTRALDALKLGPQSNQELKMNSGLTEYEAETSLTSLETRGMVMRSGSSWLLRQPF